MTRPIILAVPKGRILEEAAEVFSRAGHDLSPVFGDSRRLVHDCGPLRVLVLRSSDIATYVALQVRYARELGLAPGSAQGRRRVLDIGTGAGYFPFVCRYYGHQTAAIDLDTTPMYNDLVRLLGVDRVTWRVVPFVPLPDFPERFDCVTAMQLKFNTRPNGGPWGREEWGFFLEDLANRVAHPDAQVFLGFNADRSGVAVASDLAAFLREGGATVDDWKVTLPSLRTFARDPDGKA